MTIATTLLLRQDHTLYLGCPQIYNPPSSASQELTYVWVAPCLPRILVLKGIPRTEEDECFSVFCFSNCFWHCRFGQGKVSTVCHPVFERPFLWEAANIRHKWSGLSNAFCFWVHPHKVILYMLVHFPFSTFSTFVVLDIDWRHVPWCALPLSPAQLIWSTLYPSYLHHDKASFCPQVFFFFSWTFYVPFFPWWTWLVANGKCWKCGLKSLIIPNGLNITRIVV